MITEPQDQIVFNTLYFQKQLEHNNTNSTNNTPANEYLSKLINSNMKTFLNTSFNNCILLGFDVVIENLDRFNIRFNILPGLAILDDFLFELNNNTIFTLNLDMYKNIYQNRKILISLSCLHNKLIINLNVLDNNNNFLDSGFDSDINYLPIKIYDIQFKDTEIVILNLDDESLIYNQQSNLYNLISSLYMDLQYTGNISEIRSRNRLLDFPRNYVINNKNYLIPNYGKHYDFATNLIKILVNNLSIMNFPVRNVYEIFE